MNYLLNGLYKFFIFCLFIEIANGENSKKPSNKNNFSLWRQMKNHQVENLSENEKIFYSLWCIRENIDTLNNLKYILQYSYPIPLNVFILRKYLEERIAMLKDSETKKFLVQQLMNNYQHYKHNYKAITKDFKIITILDFLRKKYIVHYHTYKCAYDYLQSLAYYHSDLSIPMLRQLYNLYAIDLEKRFIMLFERNRIKSAIETALISENPLLINIAKRIIFLMNSQQKPKFFLNIFELHWYIVNFYDQITAEEIANIIINNRDLLMHIPYSHSQLKINILLIVQKILPSLIMGNYFNLTLLLAEDFVEHYEPSAHLFSFIKGVYAFFQRKYRRSLSYFSQAMAKHTTLQERAKYGFWIANSLGALGQKEEATDMYYKTAILNLPYYSNMSYVLIGKKPHIKSIDELYVEKNSPYDWYFNAIKIVAMDDDFLFALNLINAISIDALVVVSSSMLNMLTTLRNLSNQSYITLLTGKIQENTGLIFKEGFPLIHYMDKYSNHLGLLTSAILRKESFLRLTDENLVSTAGASGIMQVMPATAKSFCERHKIPYCQKNLKKNNHFNIDMGVKFYLKNLYF
jgi:hypothetical protein